MSVAPRLAGLLPPLALMLAIFLLSSVPGPTPDQPGWSGLIKPAVQNLLHVPVFALLAWLWARSLSRFPALNVGLVVAGSILIGAAWGLFDEFHQFHVPGRYASGLDVLLDGLGSLLGAAFWWARQRTDRRIQ